MNNVKATILWEDKRITFEGPHEFVATQVARFANQESKTETPVVIPQDYIAASSLQFVAGKAPKGHHEIVAVLAFFLLQQGIEEFTESDIRRAYLQAHVRPPKAVGQALRDAKNKYDYLAPGRKRGTYRLSSHGDRTVRFDLPRRSR